MVIFNELFENFEAGRRYERPPSFSLCKGKIASILRDALSYGELDNFHTSQKGLLPASQRFRVGVLCDAYGVIDDM